MTRHANGALLMIALLLPSFTGGCNLIGRFRTPAATPTPVAFTSEPTLDAAIAAVNANSARIQSLQSEGARIAVRGAPAISADLTIDRPLRMRFKAGTSVTGQLVDLGSNDELFWFWTSLDRQPALYYARHEEFARSQAARMVPIEPQWIVDALGVVSLDASARHEGPYRRERGVLEIRSRIPTAEGEATKSTFIHDRFAWVLGQQIHDARGRLVATTQASDHQYYPLQQVALPRKVKFDLPVATLQFEIDAVDWRINQPPGNPDLLFALPTDEFPNVPLTNLVDANAVAPGNPSRGPVRGAFDDGGYPAPTNDATRPLRPTETDRRWRSSDDPDVGFTDPAAPLGRAPSLGTAPAVGSTTPRQRGLEPARWR